MTLPLPVYQGPGFAGAGSPLQPGAVVANKYRIERRLGSGGMGEVYLALHGQLGRHVALKVLRPEALREPGLRERFQREAMVVARLTDEHIARVFDVGEMADGAPFMVMEYLEGLDLAAYLEQRGPLPPAEALDLLWQACAGIQVAHEAGVIHRDLKPANLFLLPRPGGGHLLKILDFGIAKASALPASATTLHGAPAPGPAAPGPLTDAATLLGSARYMAPEQVESARDVDARADIWSLGVIGYRLLTGRVPFEGESFEELFLSMSMQRREPLSRLRPDAPPALASAIERCLQPSRDARWPSAAALQAALFYAAPRPPPPPSNLTGPKLIAGLLAALCFAAFWLIQIFAAWNDAHSERIELADNDHAEPLDLLPLARARAQKLAPPASLSFLSVSGGKNGSVDVDVATVAFTFSTPRGKSRSLIVSTSLGRLQSEENSLPQTPLAAEPRCRYGQAWKAAVGAGLPANAEHEATYGINGRGAWIFETRAGGGKHIEVDGQTCAPARGR